MVIVYHIDNYDEMKQQLSSPDFQKYITELKRTFQEVVQSVLSTENVLSLHDFFSENFTLLVRVDYRSETSENVEKAIWQIADNVQTSLKEKHQIINMSLNTGYAFIEKNNGFLQETIVKAHQIAFLMAVERQAFKYDEMANKIKKIIVNKEIRVLAQPILDMETKEVRACEMLTRGPCGTSLESPLRLFSIAKQMKCLYDLEMIVLDKTLEQIKSTTWKQDIFINFTPLTIGNHRFVRELMKKMKKYKEITPKRITIEVTERESIEGLQYFIPNLRSLREMGFRIAVDDTGSGYASLHSINEIMPDIIKIDRSVIQNIDKSSVKESMLKGILLIAKEIGSIVVAEGIENEEEALVLSRYNIDLAQGYFYGRPASLNRSI
ncbi:EAL domain-containing protein [Niallia nealsonii]|nr:EAL domain-containing protein [Niallia nealsonii]